MPRVSSVGARVRGALAACLLAVTAAGCAASDQGVSDQGVASTRDATHDPSDGVSLPPSGGRADYQLGEAYRPGDDVVIVARDRTAAPASGRYSICYVNGFQTQPGELDLWPDDLLVTVDGERVVDPDWPDEVILDTSTPQSRAGVVQMVTPWIRGCADAGFDAVEFDNLDSFTRSRGHLSADDNRAVAREYVRVAHEMGLAAGQKNAAELAESMRTAAGFDFAIAEECAAYRECDAYTRAYGDAVIDIEYTDNLPRTWDAICADAETPPSVVLRDRELTGPADDDHVAEHC